MISLYAVGDVGPEREEPNLAFAKCLSTLREADIRFCQLEKCFSERGSRSVAARSVHRSHPKNFTAIKLAGFDVVSFAGNHCLDWGIEAFSDTIELIKNSGIEIVGAGVNITEAKRPAILERKGVKIAFLAYNSILPAGYWADVNKPGCAPIRVRTIYEMIEYDQPGCPCRILTFVYPDDLEMMKEDIKKARSLADMVVVSLHGGLHFVRTKIPMYQKEISYAAIDAGADSILWHHAHILKGIEVYQGKVIFYGLGNFAWDSSFRTWPNLTPGQKELLETYDWKIDPDWAATYPFPRESRQSMIAKTLISPQGVEKVAFLPVMINKQAQPEVLHQGDKNFAEVAKYVAEISREEGISTRFSIEEDEICIETE